MALFLFGIALLFMYITVHRYNNCLAIKLPPDRFAVVYRSHSPTHAMLERVVKLKNDLPPNYDLIMSVDLTSQNSEAERKRLLDMYAAYNLNVTSYDEDDMVAAFPHLHDAIFFPNGTEKSKSPRFYEMHLFPWGFHTEAIMLWWMKHGAQYDYVWILEDDMSYTGNMKQLLTSFGDTNPPETEFSIIDSPIRSNHTQPYDFISAKPWRVTGDWWIWMNVYTDQFDALYSGRQRFVSAEHVQRMSRRFLEQLYTLTTLGVHMWSEEFPNTVCARMPLTCNFGSLHPYIRKNYGIRMALANKEEWEEFRKMSEHKNELVHSLKF